MRLTTSDNGITNAIEIGRSPAGALRLVCSNNDCAVRVLDGEAFRVVGQVRRRGRSALHALSYSI